MVWDVIVTAEFVVVSVAVLACFAVKFLLTWLKKRHQGISQHRLFDLIALCAKVPVQIQDCGLQAEGKKNGLCAGSKRRTI